MLTAQIEPLSEHLEELKPHFGGHWQDLALNKDKVPLDPQYDIYLKRAAAGEVLFCSLREDGKIAGYFVGFVAPGLHYKSCLTLTMDIFYVLPEVRERHKAAGLRLFRCVEKEAKRRGVQRIFYGSKLHKDVGRLFQALGLEPVEQYYTKWIGD